VAEPADNLPDEEPLDGEIVAEVRHLPVPPTGVEPGMELDRPRPASVPAAAAAATGGFLLGVAAFMLIKVLRRPSAGRSLSRRRARVLAKRRGVDVQASRSFLVDIHMLKR
jgi:hypothetical protein